MMRRLIGGVLGGLVALGSVLGSGCVAPFDPEATNRVPLETRAEAEGKMRTPPPREGLRLFKRGDRPLPKPPTAAETIGRFEPMPDATELPDTRAGRQMSWLLGQFNGGNSRQIDLHFTRVFLTRTSESKVRGSISQWRRDEFADGGAEVFKIDSGADDQVSVVLRGLTTNHYSRVQVGTDKAGRISGLTMTALPDFKPGNLTEWSKIDAKLTALGVGSARSSLAVYEIAPDGLKPVHTYEAGRVMSIDAVAGLYIAGALAEEVRAGRLAWDKQIQIQDDFKSLMGGRLQLEPAEAEFPVSRYLELMLGSGDTTAFDHMLGLAGSDKVEAYMAGLCSDPSRNRPFLRTMEFYQLKLGSNRALPKQYAETNESGRQSILTSGAAAKSIPSLVAAANWRLPYEIEHIGWFATADDCCRLMADLHAREQQPGMEPLAKALRMSEGLNLNPAEWKSAAFKSGTEPGVLAMVWLLERADGKWFVLALTANDPKRAVNQTELTTCAGAAVKLVAEGLGKN